MADIEAGSYSADSYAAWNIGPDSPLASIAGGTGVQNPTTPPSTSNAGLLVIPSTGCSSASFIGLPLLDAVSTVPGSKVNVVCYVNFNATSTTPSFLVTVPSSTTAPFTDIVQAIGVAEILGLASVGSYLVKIGTNVGTNDVIVSFVVSTAPSAYTAAVSFSYIVI